MASKSQLNDPLFPLMRSLERHLLLTADEEIELSRLIQQGEQQGASKLAKRRAKKALDKLVLCNMRLCVKVCRTVHHLYRAKMELSDLVSEGVFGLQTAAKKFDYTRGYKFSTYAFWWIRQSAVRAIHTQSTSIRIPVNKWDLTSKYLKYRNQFVAKHGRNPSNNELMEGLSITASQIKSLEHAFCLQHNVSLDSPQTENPEETGGTFLDLLASPSTSESFEELLMQDTLHILMQKLDKKDQYIIQSRHGVMGSEVIARKLLAKQLDISGERVRQREIHALRKLRNYAKQNPTVDQRLHDLYD